MFDIGFWELSIIGVVALLVVGPERLPAMARTVGMYAGKMRRWVAQVRGEVERELRAEEIRQAMRDSDVGETVRAVKDAVRMDDIKDAFKTAGTAIKDAADTSGKTAEATSTAKTESKPDTAIPAPAVESAAVAAQTAVKPPVVDAEAPQAKPTANADAPAAEGQGGRERDAG